MQYLECHTENNPYHQLASSNSQLITYPPNSLWLMDLTLVNPLPPTRVDTWVFFALALSGESQWAVCDRGHVDISECVKINAQRESLGSVECYCCYLLDSVSYTTWQMEAVVSVQYHYMYTQSKWWPCICTTTENTVIVHTNQRTCCNFLAYVTYKLYIQKLSCTNKTCIYSDLKQKFKDITYTLHSSCATWLIVTSHHGYTVLLAK